MADNVTYQSTTPATPPSGTVVATDDDGTAQHQYVKLEWGPDNTQTKVGSGANALPIQDGGNSITVDDGAGSLTVDGTVTANLAAGTNNIGDVDVLTVPAPLSTTGGGTEATALRVTVATDSTGVLSVDDNGGSLTVDGTVTANLAAGTNNIGDVDVLTVPAPLSTTGNGTAATALRVTVASDSTGVIAVTDNSGSLTVDNAGTFAVQDSQVVTDNAAFTDGTTKVQPVGYIFDEVAGTALTENDAAAARIDSKRAQVGVIEDATTRGQRAAVSAAGALSVNNAQIAGNTISAGNGVSGTGVQRVTLASDSTGQVAVASLPASTNTLEVVGDVAEDAALAGNPLRQGVRAHSGVPTAMSADNDVVTPWADLSGAQIIIPQPRTFYVVQTPTIATSGYVAGDQVGGLITFTSAALASGRGGDIVGATLTTRTPGATNQLELWLAEASPTIASSDNAAFDLTDGNNESARWFAVIDFSTGRYRASSSNAICIGEMSGGPVCAGFVASGSANVFGVLVVRTVSAQYAGTSDITVALRVRQF